MTRSTSVLADAQITQPCDHRGLGRHFLAIAPNSGYLRAAAGQRQLQNVTGSLGPHGGLRGRHAAVTSGYHLSKRHRDTVTLDGSVPDDEVLELIGHACDLVVAHLTRAQQGKLIT